LTSRIHELSLALKNIGSELTTDDQTSKEKRDQHSRDPGGADEVVAKFTSIQNPLWGERSEKEKNALVWVADGSGQGQKFPKQQSGEASFSWRPGQGKEGALLHTVSWRKGKKGKRRNVAGGKGPEGKSLIKAR